MKTLFNFIIALMLLSCSAEKEQPNILWITCEDISPYLGSYGYKEAYTPNLDKLAANGIRYTNAYTNAPVCAVARSVILSGMHATTIGTHHMRAITRLPENIPAYSKILREAGYYCTNNAKKDYNSNLLSDTTLWDESNRKAHYKNREEGQPFFAVFNLMTTHESKLSEENVANYIATGQIPEKTRINPKVIELPPYHPDLPEVRQDWARFHDLITRMDEQVGELLDELDEQGLSDNTIVMFYSDHGGQLARSKRYLYNTGTQVPLIIKIPEKWKHLTDKIPGSTDSNLVSFVDFPKTLLSMVGSEVPDKMQGRIFLGRETEDAPEYVHFYRNRMGERYDFARAVTDGRYNFIRNFMPYRPRGRTARYPNKMQANWRAWEKHYEAGKCNEVQAGFFQPKPLIELYHTPDDPWQVNDLSQDQQYAEALDRLSGELDRWMIETRDVGLIPEPMIADLVGEGKNHKTLYEYAQSSDYTIERILEAAKVSASGAQDVIAQYVQYIKDPNPVIRYWGANGLFLARPADEAIRKALKAMAVADEYAANRIMANQALGSCGSAEEAFKNLLKECKEAKTSYLLLQGVDALQYAGLDDRLTKEDWQSFNEKEYADPNDGMEDFGATYSKRIIKDALGLWPDRRKVD